jgi:hypothetical protein
MKAITAMIGSALDADDSMTGLLLFMNIDMNWTKPISSVLSEPFRQHTILIRPVSSTRDFVGNRDYISVIDRHIFHTEWGDITLRLVAEAAVLILSHATRPFYLIEPMHTPSISSHFNETNGIVIKLMSLEQWELLICHLASLQGSRIFARVILQPLE